MIDRRRLLVSTFIALQDRIGTDAIPPRAASDAFDILGLNGKDLADLLNESLLSRRWGGFLAVSQSGRESELASPHKTDPRSEDAASSQRDAALVRMAATATEMCHLCSLPVFKSEKSKIVSDVRAVVDAVIAPQDASEPLPALLERISGKLTVISQIKSIDGKVLDATKRLLAICSEISSLPHC